MGTTLYERVGGDAWFTALVERFYTGVETDPVLRPLYPAELGDSRRHLALFLGQYFGGPQRYQELRGHPALRMRHRRFSIGVQEQDAWLGHMTAAVRSGGLAAADEAEVLAYFGSAAAMLRNDHVPGRGHPGQDDGVAAGRTRLKLVPEQLSADGEPARRDDA
jgi:hemoglobin